MQPAAPGRQRISGGSLPARSVSGRRPGHTGLFTHSFRFQHANSAEHPASQGSWSLTWGSIFVSASTGATGVAVGKPTKREAIAEALGYCSSKGAKDCVEEVTYENSCVALADSVTPMKLRGAVGGGVDEQQAGVSAKNLCEKDGDVECKVSYSACSKPVFRPN